MKRIVILVNGTRPGAAEIAGAAAKILRQKGLESLRIIEDRGGAQAIWREEGAHCDAVIAVGGDGTILSAARMALLYGTPVLGINAGRLGFLAGLERDELHWLPGLLTGDYTVEHRMLLDVCVWRGDEKLCEIQCVNDAVLSRRNMPRLAEIPVECDGHVLTYLGDGVIFSTPTGSTAYCFSAGGPVADPRMEAILLTPLCNHKLFDRTILFSAGARFSVSVAQEGVVLCCDGESMELLPGQTVAVCRAKQTTQLIRMKQRHFLETLNEKLINR